MGAIANGKSALVDILLRASSDVTGAFADERLMKEYDMADDTAANIGRGGSRRERCCRRLCEVSEQPGCVLDRCGENDILRIYQHTLQLHTE